MDKLKPAAQNQPIGETPKNNYRNLYYHHDFAEGLRFGARLVPVARPFSWHPDLQGGVGLSELIGPPAQRNVNRWWETRQGGVKNMGTVPPEIDSLHEFLTVRDPTGHALEEAMWH